MIKKRVYSFLIVEVLIAFLLISMTILPFTSFPYKAFKKELTALEEMTVEPYVLQSFLEALENEESLLDDLTVPFGEKDTLLIKRKATKSYKREENKTKSSLLTIELELKTKNSKQKRQKLFVITPKRGRT